MVTPVDGSAEWRLTDLLGRSMGVIKEAGAEEFLIEPDGNAIGTMDGMGRGPFRSLDDALAAIETRTRGVCRRQPDEA